MAEFPQVKIEIFIPEEFVTKLGDALTEIGAGRLGNYDHCMSSVRVKGYWRPTTGAVPYQGKVGKIEIAEECKVEINCPWELVGEALGKIREIHPYEEPMIQVVPLLNHLFN